MEAPPAAGAGGVERTQSRRHRLVGRKVVGVAADLVEAGVGAGGVEEDDALIPDGDRERRFGRHDQAAPKCSSNSAPASAHVRLP